MYHAWLPEQLAPFGNRFITILCEAFYLWTKFGIAMLALLHWERTQARLTSLWPILWSTTLRTGRVTGACPANCDILAMCHHQHDCNMITSLRLQTVAAVHVHCPSPDIPTELIKSMQMPSLI